MNLDLDFFNPKSIAVVGASAKEGSYSSRPLKNLLEHGFSGSIYVVNPGYAEVSGVQSYPRIRDLPEIPELVLIAVNAGLAVEALRDAGEFGVRNAIIVAGGFKEVGNFEGERALREIANHYKMAVIGPNCTGMLNFVDRVPASSTLFFRSGGYLRVGAVSVVSQSGGMALSMLRTCSDRRIGLGYWLSVGNQACVNAIECVSVLLESEDVSAVALYVEGLGGVGRDLLNLGHKAALLNKFVVVLKAGTSGLGQRLAVTHTGALSGPGEVTPSLLRQAGIVEAETLEDLADIMALVGSPNFCVPQGVGVMSTGGGFTVMSADACAKYHVPLAPVSAATSEALRPFVPAFASVDINPMDITALDPLGNALTACEILLQAEETDCVLLIIGGEDVARYSAKLAAMAEVGRTNKTLFVIGLGGVDSYGRLDDAVKDAIADAEIPMFGNPIRAIRALGLIGRYAHVSAKTNDRGRIQRPTGDSDPITRIPDSQYLVGVLQQFGISTPKQVLMDLDVDVSSVRHDLSYPLVAKIVSDASSNHKSELGLVKVGISDESELREVISGFRERAIALGPPLETFHLLLQEFVNGDVVEVLVGGVRHPEYGPLVTVGSGGVLTELIHDVNYGLAPLSALDARRLFATTKIASLVGGYRGEEAFDVEACISSIVGVSEIISQVDELEEFEINPLMVSRRGAMAVDVRGVFRKPDGPADDLAVSLETKAHVDLEMSQKSKLSEQGDEDASN